MQFSDEQLLGTVVLAGMMLPIALMALWDLWCWSIERLRRWGRPDLFIDMEPVPGPFEKWRMK